MVILCPVLAVTSANYPPEAGRQPLSLRITPAPTRHARPQLDGAYVAPGEGTEKVIAEVWQQVLGVEQVGLHDNFFELGGTSLNGVQVISELKKRLQREIPAVSIFEAPTVAALARYLAPKADAGPAFEKTRSRVDKKKAALERRRQEGPRRRR